MEDSFQMISMSRPKCVMGGNFFAVAIPLHTSGRLDQENLYRTKREWHTVDTVVTA